MPQAFQTLLLLSLLLCPPCLAYADWGFPEEDDVVMLDIYSHDRFIKEFPEVMVYYFVDDCKHCTEFKPIYHKLALDFKERKNRLPLAQLDCTEHLQFCNNKLIPVYPYLKFFVMEHPLIYNQKREYETVKNYLEYMADRKPDRTSMKGFQSLFEQFYNPRELDPSLFEAEELEAEVEARNKNRNSVIGVFFGRRSKNKKLFRTFQLYFRYDSQTEFLHIKKLPELNTSNLKILGDVMAENDSLNGKVVLFFRDRTRVFKGKPTFDNFENAVHELKYPLINYLDQEYYNSLGFKRQSLVVLFTPTADHWAVRQLSRLANQFRKKFSFIMVPDDSEFGELVLDFKKKFLFLEKDEYDLEEEPQMRVVQFNYSFVTAKKYSLDEPFSYDSALRMIIDYNAKKLKPFVVTEKLEQETYEGSRIRFLNAKNYAESIRVPGQISIVLYHDGFDFNIQSKLFLNYLIELSDDTAMKNVEFFLIDASKNEIPDFYDDERPVLLIYSPNNLHAPLIYNKAFSKFRILKMIGKARKVKTPQEQLEKMVFKKK